MSFELRVPLAPPDPRRAASVRTAVEQLVDRAGTPGIGTAATTPELAPSVPVAAGPRVPASLAPAALRGLQQRAGNAAVTGLLGGPAAMLPTTEPPTDTAVDALADPSAAVDGLTVAEAGASAPPPSPPAGDADATDAPGPAPAPVVAPPAVDSTTDATTAQEPAAHSPAPAPTPSAPALSAPAPSAPAPTPSAPRPRPAGRSPGPVTTGGLPRTRSGSSSPGGANSARPSLGDAALEHWNAARSEGQAGVAAPELVAGAAAAATVEGAAAARVADRRASEPDYAAEVQATQPPAPATAEKSEALDTSEAEQAIADVQSLADRRLSPATFSPLGPLPTYEGLNPRDYVPATLTDALADAEARLLDPELSQAERVTLTAQVDTLQQRVAAIEEQAGLGAATVPPSVTDPGAASLEPPPAAQGEVLGDAVARAIATIPGRGRRLALAAARPIDGGRSAPLRELAAAKATEVEQELRTELTQIAGAAGVAAESLSVKVAEQRAVVEAQAAANTAALAQAADGGLTARASQGAAESAQIAGAKQAVDREVAATQAAAAGPADTAAIEAKRDELLGNLESAGAQVMAAYRSSLEGRTSTLGEAARGQHAEIQSLADRQAAAIRRHHAEDPEAGAIESLPTRNWAVTRAEQVDVEVGRFTRAAAAENGGFVMALNARLSSSRTRVRDWAARQQGRERSWWERLIDSIRDWGKQAEASSAQWEQQRAADNRDAMAADLTALSELRAAQRSGSQAELTAAMGALDEEQQALAARYLQGDGLDSIGFVAESTMLRITRRRQGELTESLREEVVADWDWEQLGILARATQPGFQPAVIAAQVRGAISGIGTVEDALFAALGTARGPIERAAVEKCYLDRYGAAMSEDVSGDVSGSEWERAQALMAGGGAEVAVATIVDAMSGAGTDEAAIRNALRGRSPAELEEIKALYRERHGMELDAALADDLSGEELANAVALASGDTAAADAADLRDAMSGPGTDEEKIQQVYDTIRREVEADAQRRGLSTAEMNAEIRRRNDAVRDTYEQTSGRSLAADFADDLGGAEHELAQALAGGDLSQIDAARAKVEDEAIVYSSDDRIEDVVRNQHRRATLEAQLDLGAQRARAEALLRSGDIDRAQYQERLTQWEQDTAGLETEVARRAQQNMADLRSEYGELAGVGGDSAFEYMIRMRTQGYSEGEILALVQGGGRLSPEQEIYYAVMGVGTDEERLQETLRGKTPAQIQEIRTAYEARFPGRSFDDDILGDLSGREDLDTEMLLEMGDPSTFAAQLRAERDPARRAALLARMDEYLQRRREFEETGAIGSFLLVTGADSMNTVAQMEDAMAAARALDAALTVADGDPQDPAVVAAEHRMDMNFAGAVESQEQLRKQIDGYAEIAVQVGVVIAGIAVTAATLGTAGPIVAAMYGAAASAAVGMTMNARLRGLAYSWEEAGVDAAVGVMDAATAGLGARYLAPIARSSGMLQLVAGALADGLEGVPSALLETGLDDGIWASGDPFGTFLATGGTALATGAALSVGLDAAGGGYGMLTGPRPRPRGGDAAGGPAGGVDLGGPVPGSAPGASPPAGAPPVLDVPPAADPAAAAARAAAGEVPAGTPPEATSSGPVPDVPRPDGPERPPRTADTGDTGDTGETIDLDDPANAHLIEEIDGVDQRRPHVGDDGVIDLDDPRNRFLLEDRFAGMLPEEAALDPVASRAFFEGFVRSQPQIEAGLLRNAVTGQHIVVQGSPASVDIRPGHGVWEGLVPPSLLGTGRWDLVVHSHPVDASGTTPEFGFLPSGATGDFAWASYQAGASGQPVVQEIHVTTADGPDVSRYGYDPDHSQPYSVDFPSAASGREVHRFDTIEDYHDWYHERFGGEMEPVPDWFAGTRRRETGAIGDDDPTVEMDLSELPTQEIDISEMPTASGSQPHMPGTAPGTPTAAGSPSAPARFSTDLGAGHPGLTTTLNDNPGLRDRLDAAVFLLGTRGGGLTTRDRATIAGRLTASGGTGRITKSQLLHEIVTLERLLERLTQRPEWLTDAGLQQRRTVLTEQAELVLHAYDNRVTHEREGRTISDSPELADEMDRLRQLMTAPSEADTVAELVRLEQLQQDIARAGEILRSYGASRWDVSTVHDTPTQSRAAEQVHADLAATGKPLPDLSAAEVLAVTEVSSTEVTATGTLGESISRDLPGVGLERYVLRPSELRGISEPPGLGERLATMLSGYQRAHLVGPGFGDERFVGIMLAPEQFNLTAQNQGIEKLLRAFEGTGQHVEVRIRATGTRHAIPLGNGEVEYVDILSTIRYDITGHARLSAMHAEYRIAPPPDGTATITTNIPSLTVAGLPELPE